MNPIIVTCEGQIERAMRRLGVLLLLWRRQFHMTQGDLAERTGLMQSYISGLEQGHIDPRMSTMYRIIYGFDDVSVQTFFKGPDDPIEGLFHNDPYYINFH